MDLLLGPMPTQGARFLVQVPSASPAQQYCCESQPGLEEQGIHPNPPCAKGQDCPAQADSEYMQICFCCHLQLIYF